MKQLCCRSFLRAFLLKIPYGIFVNNQFLLCQWLIHGTPPRRSYHDRTMGREDEGNQAAAFHDRRTRRQGNRSERHALHSPRRPQCEGLCEAQRRRGFKSAPSKATDEGKEGQQDEIHLFGFRAERMVKGQRWSLLARWINLSSGKRQEPKVAVCAQPQALHGPCAERERGPALELPLRRRDVEQ